MILDGVEVSKGRRRRLLALADLFGWSCHYCGESLTWATATQDHVWPVSRRGRTEIFNLVMACQDCNVRLGTSTPKCDCRWCVRATQRGRQRLATVAQAL